MILLQFVTIYNTLGPILQELFLKWSTLSKREKILLNYLSFYIIEKNQIELFAPIIQGFSYWNSVQDREGDNLLKPHIYFLIYKNYGHS